MQWKQLVLLDDQLDAIVTEETTDMDIRALWRSSCLLYTSDAADE